MAKAGYFKRYRFPIAVIRTAVILHMVMPSRFVALVLYLLFKTKVTHKTVCGWTQKFTPQIVLPNYVPAKGTLICHADEKYVKVNGVWNYWWSIQDAFGNLIHSIITPSRDLDSAKKLMGESRGKIGRTVDILIRDGLSAYDKAAKLLGRRCESIVAGIQGKGILHKGHFYWVTNNPAESLNSEIGFYLKKFQNNFRNMESANLFAHTFSLLKYLKKCFAEKKLSEATSLLNSILPIEEVPCFRD
jgi:transposase-like protein